MDWKEVLKGAIKEGEKNFKSLKHYSKDDMQVVHVDISKATHLDFSYSCIGNEEARIIAENLGNLTSLNLSYNKITDEGIKAIAENLGDLTSLNLSYNKITDEGAKAIAENLGNLTSLNLCSIDDSLTKIYLCNVIEKNKERIKILVEKFKDIFLNEKEEFKDFSQVEKDHELKFIVKAIKESGINVFAKHIEEFVKNFKIRASYKKQAQKDIVSKLTEIIEKFPEGATVPTSSEQASSALSSKAPVKKSLQDAEAIVETQSTVPTSSEQVSSASSSEASVEKSLQALENPEDKRQTEDCSSQLKKQFSGLEVANSDLKTKLSQLEADNADLKSQLSQLKAQNHSQKSSSSVDNEWTLLDPPSKNPLMLGPTKAEVDVLGEWQAEDFEFV